MFAEEMVNGIPLLFVVLGLVSYVKAWGLSGNAIRATSMLIGLLFGFGYMASSSGFPVDFPGWFSYTFYGLGLGITASGVYDAGTNLAVKAISQFAKVEK